MSMGAYKWALSWDGLSSPEKFVLVVIADHYNDKVHRAWPSIDTIARYTGLGRSTVKRAIKRLEQEGLIEVEPWRSEGSSRALNNRYCLPWFDQYSVRSAVLPVVRPVVADRRVRRLPGDPPRTLSSESRHERRSVA